MLSKRNEVGEDCCHCESILLVMERWCDTQHVYVDLNVKTLKVLCKVKCPVILILIISQASQRTTE